jgi:hypothetical protein
MKRKRVRWRASPNLTPDLEENHHRTTY